MNKVLEYLDDRGESPFEGWFSRLNVPAAAKVATALVRMELGNLSNAQGGESGVFEYPIAFGPEYRIYFGKDGEALKDEEALIVLIGGGTKKRQRGDIATAMNRWRDYENRKSDQNQQEE